MKVSTNMLAKIFMLSVAIFMLVNLSSIPLGFGETTQLKAVAPTTAVEVPNAFKVDIEVVNVTDLYAWQVMLYYNPTVLEWINVTLPSGHFFEGKPGGNVIYSVNRSDAQGVYVLCSVSLQGDVSGVSGSGTLCQIFFRAQEAGTSWLNFSRPLGEDTWLWDSNLNDISFSVVDASVSVTGYDPRPYSEITISLDKSFVWVGENLTISGSINVTVPDGTEVFIEYWNFSWPSEYTWHPLIRVGTQNSNYSYVWAPSPDDTSPLLGLRARWEGNTNYRRATSETWNVTIKMSPTWLKVQQTPQGNLTGVTHTEDRRPYPLPTLPFVLNITIENVTDLYEWKVKMTFDQTILEAINISIPAYNIFGEDYTIIESIVNNTEGFVQLSVNSTASTGYDGSGVLFQVAFRGIGAPTSKGGTPFGLSELKFQDKPLTEFKNSTGSEIFVNWDDPAGLIEIYASERRFSQISLKVPVRVKLNTNLTLTGEITPSGAGKHVNVTIKCKKGTLLEETLAVVETDDHSTYTYLWLASELGTYVFNVSWPGDEVYQGAYVVKTVEVVEEITAEGGLDLTPYIVITVVVVVVVVGLVVYLKKFRKPKQIPPE